MHSKLFSLQLQLHSVYLVRTLPTDETCLSFWCSYLTEKTYCGLKWVAGMWHASPASTWYDCQMEHNNVCRFDNDVNQLMPLSVSHEISHTLCCCLRFQSHRPEGEKTLQKWEVIIGNVKSDVFKDTPWHIYALREIQLMICGIWTISLMALIIS